CSVR
ncbi:tail assembly protein I, partial [Escherichia coli ARS4.2123]